MRQLGIANIDSANNKKKSHKRSHFTTGFTPVFFVFLIRNLNTSNKLFNEYSIAPVSFIISMLQRQS